MIVRDGVIDGIVTVPETTPVGSSQIQHLLHRYQHYHVLNCEHDYILPGLIDLNVRPDSTDVGLIETTKAALAGGVTFLIQETTEIPDATPQEELYVDVGRSISPTLITHPSLLETAFAVKTHLFQPHIDSICVENVLRMSLSVTADMRLPLLLDLFYPPLSASMVNTPFRALPVVDRRCQPLPACNPAAFSDTPSTVDTVDVFTFTSDSQENTPLKRSTTSPPSLVVLAKEVIKRRRSTKDKDLILLSQMEQTQYAASGVTIYEKQQKDASNLSGNPRNRLRARLTSLITTKTTDTESARQYLSYLANYPEKSELDGVQMLVSVLDTQSTSPIHIVNVSSETALAVLQEVRYRRESMTIETEGHFLYFNAERIEDGNTLLKCTPPIRDDDNRKILLSRFNEGVIDCVGSGHVGFEREEKDLQGGNFKRAVSGIAGLGYCLQATWTVCKTDKVSENERVIGRLVQAMATIPAEVIGVERERGSIETGKQADLVVWQPYEYAEVERGLHPYGGERLAGVVRSVYLRGQRVYHAGVYSAQGRRMNRVLKSNP